MCNNKSALIYHNWITLKWYILNMYMKSYWRIGTWRYGVYRYFTLYFRSNMNWEKDWHLNLALVSLSLQALFQSTWLKWCNHFYSTFSFMWFPFQLPENLLNVEQWELHSLCSSRGFWVLKSNRAKARQKMLFSLHVFAQWWKSITEEDCMV